MSRTFKGPVTSLRTSISGAESNPSSGSDGIASLDTRTKEIAFFISGGTSCDATVWWYDDAQDAWCSGTAQSVTGNKVVNGFNLGSKVAVRLTSVSGTYAISYQWLPTGTS